MNTFVDTILSGQEVNQLDPSKDLIESFPLSNKIFESNWLMLQWVITKDGLPNINNNSNSEIEDDDYQMDVISKVIEYYPDCMNELDKKGQHYMVYIIRTNSVYLFNEILKYNRRISKLKDGSGKMLIHYCAMYAIYPELLYCVCESMGKSIIELATSCIDDNGNLPIHCCASGCSSVQILKEVNISINITYNIIYITYIMYIIYKCKIY